MASNPQSSCCFTDFKHDGVPAGEIKSINNSAKKISNHLSQFYTYISSSSSTILLLTDIFGLSPNAQLLADSFATTGYLAVLPDLFAGDAMEIGAFEAGEVDIPAWLSRYGSDAVDGIVGSVIRYLREELGVEKIAGGGYCDGGKVVRWGGTAMKFMARLRSCC